MKFHLWRQMSEKLFLDLDSCFLPCTVAPKIYCLTEKTGLQDSLSVKTEWESVKYDNNNKTNEYHAKIKCQSDFN